MFRLVFSSSLNDEWCETIEQPAPEVTRVERIKAMWKEDSIKIGSKIYHYQAKVYDMPSNYGINQGRISKLSVSLEGRTVINYDRGWDKKPVTQEEESVLSIILNSYS